MSNADIKVVKTTMWSAGCGSHGGCGVKLCVQNGKLVKIEGDETHPQNNGRLCPKGLALTQYIYHKDRIRYPLKRVGERGEGKWQRISWNEAYDIIEKKLKDIRDKYGAESVLFAQGTGRDIGGPLTFLMYNYGSPNLVQIGLAGHACYTPRLGAMFVTQGGYCVVDAAQFLEKKYNDPQWEPPKYIILWGQSPFVGCSDAFYGHWILDCMKRGSKLIVIDPNVTWAATRADLFLQIRPGTDGALALAMLNVIINEELYDKEFVDKWTYGFDELKQRVQDFTPGWAADLTWIPEDLIIQAARLFAMNKPSAIQWGVPVDQGPEATVVSQAINHLWAITGNIDIPGGMVIARPSHNVSTYPFTSEELSSLYGDELIKKLNEKRIGADRYPMVKGFRGWGQPDVLFEQLVTGKPYPIKAAWIQTSNPIGGQAADPHGHLERLKRLDFIVVVDLFQTPTTMSLADIVLPAATFPEKESLRAWWAPLCILIKAIDVEECKSDWEINLEMAKRLSNKPIAYNTVKDLIDDRLKTTGWTYDKLAERGGWVMPPEGPSKPYRRYERGLLRKDGKPGFPTPTGKVELYSTLYEGWGLDPLPYYEEPSESPIRTPELWGKYPLINASGRRSTALFHSEHRMIPWLREIEPDPFVEIHPETAKEYGVAHGEWIYLENDRGKVKFKAKLTPTCHPKVVTTMHGWWLPETKGEAPSLFSTWEHNANNLNSMGNAARSGFGGTNYRTSLVKITKV